MVVLFLILLLLQRSFKDPDKIFFISQDKYLEHMMILPKLKFLLMFSVIDYYLIFGIIINLLLKFFLDRTKFYRFKKTRIFYIS